MAVRRKKTAIEEEKMTEANMLRVISLLEPEEEGKTPITKKEACAILGMNYNTTRLTGILQDFKERRARDKARREAKRGKPAEAGEIAFIIQEYLNGEPISTIADTNYRSSQFVKSLLERYGVPVRQPSHDYMRPELLPESSVRDRFEVGETVYSARYDSTAFIKAEKFSDKHGWIYLIWINRDGAEQFAYQPAYELGSLQHLRELGVKV